jgi:hypothetical protein
MSCPPQYTIPVGSVLVASVTWQNTGSKSYAFDIGVAIGVAGDGPSAFTSKAGNIVTDVPSNPGQTQTTDVNIGPIPSDLIGTWDIMVVIGDYDPASGDFYVIDWLICRKVLVVS